MLMEGPLPLPPCWSESLCICYVFDCDASDYHNRAQDAERFLKLTGGHEQNDDAFTYESGDKDPKSNRTP